MIIRIRESLYDTPYPDTKKLALTKEEKAKCCDTITQMMKEGAPVFNLKSAFPYLIENRFPTPCHQCVVMENGKLSTCGRCIDVPGLCDQRGYFFVAEYTLLFRGNPKIIIEMLHTYLKYIYDDLKSDIDTAFLLGANHVAIYPFIDFTFTESPVTAMPKKDKRELLDAITQYCLGKGYSRNSIWTFSSGTDANYSSMTRDNFLGFGCSATSLFKEQFKINTFDVDSYCERIRSGNLATSLTIRFTKRQRMVYWLFWTAYSTRVTAEDFEKFFGVSLKKMYGFELWVAKQLGLVKEHNGTYEMTLKGAFYYHYYENFYTLSYIDKMWGIMRKEAFPEQIEL